MLKRTDYSIFKGEEIGAFLVNPVNISGVMGKGLALEFKKRHKSYFDEYKTLCDAKKMKMGSVHIDTKRKIISFPTKTHWRNKSKTEDIRKALKDLNSKATKLKIKSIYMPMIGSGLGGLNFKKDVLPLIKYEFDESPVCVVISWNKKEEEKSQRSFSFNV